MFADDDMVCWLQPVEPPAPLSLSVCVDQDLRGPGVRLGTHRPWPPCRVPPGCSSGCWPQPPPQEERRRRPSPPSGGRSPRGPPPWPWRRPSLRVRFGQTGLRGGNPEGALSISGLVFVVSVADGARAQLPGKTGSGACVAGRQRTGRWRFGEGSAEPDGVRTGSKTQ